MVGECAWSGMALEGGLKDEKHSHVMGLGRPRPPGPAVGTHWEPDSSEWCL